MSPAGFKNIRAMFEQGNQQTPSSSGPSTPNREISPKPLGRVRTSFVAVTGNGAMVGLQKLTSPTTAVSPEISIAEGAKLAGQVVEPERIVAQSDEKEEEKPQVKDAVVTPVKDELVVKSPERKKAEPASPPKVKSEAVAEEKATPEAVPIVPAAVEKPAAEKAPTEKASTEKSATAKSSTEKSAAKVTKTVPAKDKAKATTSAATSSKTTEKKPVTAPKVAVPKATVPKAPAITKTTTSSSAPSTSTAKASTKNLTVGTTAPKKATTPIPSPRLPAAKSTTATKATASSAGAAASSSAAAKPKEKTAGPVKSVRTATTAAPRSATSTGHRSATATGLRSKTPTVSDHPPVPRKTTVPAASRLYAPTAASAARLADEKEKAKTVATTTARRPASVAAHRPKSSLGTTRPAEKKTTTASSSRATGPAKAVAGTAAAKKASKPVAAATAPAPVEEAPPVPTLPTEEFLEMITRPTTASASKIVSKEELKEIGSRSTSRMSSNQGRSSRRVSVGSSAGGSTHDGSPVSRRRKMSHSPPRLHLSPEGEDAPVIEETEEDVEVTAPEASEKSPKPSALNLLPADKVEAIDVHTPGSEATLVHEDDAHDEVETPKVETVEQQADQVIAA